MSTHNIRRPFNEYPVHIYWLRSKKKGQQEYKANLDHCTGVVGWCEGVMYLMSPGRPADIGLQLGKACYPCSG